MTDADVVRERRELDAAAQRAEKEAISTRGRRFVPAGGARMGERDRTRLTPEQWRQLGLGQYVIEWIDNEGDHWAHGDSDGVWTRAMGLPVDVPVWINGYRLTRLSPAELQRWADRIARGEE